MYFFVKVFQDKGSTLEPLEQAPSIQQYSPMNERVGATGRSPEQPNCERQRSARLIRVSLLPLSLSIHLCYTASREACSSLVAVQRGARRIFFGPSPVSRWITIGFWVFLVYSCTKAKACFKREKYAS